MPPNLHLDPVVLRAAAAAVRVLIPPLQVPDLDPVDLDLLAGAPGGARLVAEHDRLVASAARAGSELAELVAGLVAVAAAVESADCEIIAAMRTVDG